MRGIRQLLVQEVNALEGLRSEAVERGPLHAYHRLAKRELGGPILQRLVSFGAPRIFASPIGFRLVAIGGPLLFVWLLLTVANDATHEFAIVWQILLVAVLMAIGAAASAALFMLALRRTRAAIWGRVARWSLEDLAFWGLLIIIFPAVGFAALSALLVGRDLIGVKGATPEDADLATSTFEAFIWNFFDAVPLLKVPETLSWQPSLEFTTWSGGSLVLAYKIAVILPFAQLAAAMLARLFGESEAQARDEAGPPTPP